MTLKTARAGKKGKRVRRTMANVPTTLLTAYQPLVLAQLSKAGR